MTVKPLLAVLAVAVWLATAPAHAAPCISPAEETALGARYLQTELMVAALSCSEQSRYNAFVSTFRAQIGAQSAALRKLFKRVYGGNGSRQLNAYVTRLANDAAMRSAGGRKQRYCALAGDLFTKALATTPKAFPHLTRSVTVGGYHGFRSCR